MVCQGTIGCRRARDRHMGRIVMEQLLQDVLQRINACMSLEEQNLPEEIACVRYPLNWLVVKNYIWASERIRKLYSNRVTLRPPLLDVMGNGIYPADAYDVPIFIFDISLTRKKVVTYINLVKLADGPDYHAAYIEPFAGLYKKYEHFGSQPMPDWMRQYQSENCLYAMPPADRHAEVRACVMDYLDLYLRILSTAQPLSDQERRNAVRLRSGQFINDLITKDRAQKALGRLIGKKRLGLFQRYVLG